MSYKCLFIALILIINQNFNFANSQIKDTLNILFVGNSYTYFYNLPIVVNEMSKHSNSTYIKTTHSLVGGSTLENHVNQERNTKTVDYLKNNKYDFVILNHHSLATIDRGKFFETSKKIIELVKKYNFECKKTINSIFDQRGNLNRNKMRPCKFTNGIFS